MISYYIFKFELRGSGPGYIKCRWSLTGKSWTNSPGEIYMYPGLICDSDHYLTNEASTLYREYRDDFDKNSLKLVQLSTTEMCWFIGHILHRNHPHYPLIGLKHTLKYPKVPSTEELECMNCHGITIGDADKLWPKLNEYQERFTHGHL